MFVGNAFVKFGMLFNVSHAVCLLLFLSLFSLSLHVHVHCTPSLSCLYLILNICYMYVTCTCILFVSYLIANGVSPRKPGKLFLNDCRLNNMSYLFLLSPSLNHKMSSTKSMLFYSLNLLFESELKGVSSRSKLATPIDSTHRQNTRATLTTCTASMRRQETKRRKKKRESCNNWELIHRTKFSLPKRY